MAHKIAAAVHMNYPTLAVFAWLCTLGTAAGITLMVVASGAHAEFGVALLTAALITPLAYLTGRIQGIRSNGNGNGKRKE